MQAIGRQPKRAPDRAPVHYGRRRPEQTTLYRLVQQHAATFFAQAEDAAGAGLPQFVKDEFDAFLECGILAHGFLRLRCGGCGHDTRVAFSCKRRGSCPSCGARRMAQTAAHLVDHVVPHVPVRQWVLSLPIPLRLLLAAQPKLVTVVPQVVHRVITRHLLGQAGLKAAEADSGAVTLIQRIGLAANLNIHLHCLVLGGVYPFIVIGLETAMRKSEILSIRREDIDLQRRVIFIPKAKAGAREQPITEHVGEFLASYAAALQPGNPWLFPSPGAKAGHTVDVRKPFRRVVAAAGLDPDQILRHTLRHTAITHLVQAGVDLPTVKRISGHKTLAMVERYSHQNSTHIQAAMDKLQARFKLAS